MLYFLKTPDDYDYSGKGLGVVEGRIHPEFLWKDFIRVYTKMLEEADEQIKTLGPHPYSVLSTDPEKFRKHREAIEHIYNQMWTELTGYPRYNPRNCIPYVAEEVDDVAKMFMYWLGRHHDFKILDLITCSVDEHDGVRVE